MLSEKEKNINQEGYIYFKVKYYTGKETCEWEISNIFWMLKWNTIGIRRNIIHCKSYKPWIVLFNKLLNMLLFNFYYEKLKNIEKYICVGIWILKGTFCTYLYLECS